MDTLRILLSGCNGRMGRAVAERCAVDRHCEIAAGLDLLGARDREFPVFSTPAACTVEVDVVVDFSSPAALSPLLEYCVANKLPVVLATTGYDEGDKAAIAAASGHIPIFQSGNMSLGINLMLELVRTAASVLAEDYDIEIVERHHNRKVDAPSGTALMLADAAAGALPRTPAYIYERQSVRRARGRDEIGISAVRGGGIVGDHEVIFAGQNEIIELHHHAASREVFADGAVRAAHFLARKAPGRYQMADLVAECL